MIILILHWFQLSLNSTTERLHLENSLGFGKVACVNFIFQILLNAVLHISLWFTPSRVLWTSWKMSTCLYGFSTTSKFSLLPSSIVLHLWGILSTLLCAKLCMSALPIFVWSLPFCNIPIFPWITCHTQFSCWCMYQCVDVLGLLCILYHGLQHIVSSLKENTKPFFPHGILCHTTWRVSYT